MAGAIPFIALGAQAIGGLTKYRAEKKMAKAAATNAGINAALQRAQADQEELESREAIRRMEADGRLFQGRQKAMLAASGVVTSEGSPLDLIGETAGRLALERAEAGRVAERRKAMAYASAEETVRTGKLQASGYKAAATGTALSTISGLAGTAFNYGNLGVKGFGWTVPKKLGT